VPVLARRQESGDKEETMEMLQNVLVETLAGLVGIFIGTLAALAVERYKERLANRRRAKTILRALSQELSENHHTLQTVRPAYSETSFGKSFYVGTIAWETALAGGDLPAIIGVELADTIAAQYALLVRIRYYVDLLTHLWFAPADIPGYDRIRDGFHRAIIETMVQAIGSYPRLQGTIERALRQGASYPSPGAARTNSSAGPARRSGGSQAETFPTLGPLERESGPVTASSR
jgi:hypothetical protein